MGIITTAVAAALTLVQSSIRASAEAREAVVAANLGREAAEAVRSLRDANWLALRPFDAGLVSSGGDATAVPVFSPATGAWSMDFDAADALADDGAVVYRHIAAGEAEGSVVGLYRQLPDGASAPTSAVASGFRRMVTLNALCDTPPTGIAPAAPIAPTCPAGSEKVGIQVFVDLAWELPGRSRTQRIEYLLYDWRS